ncbi:MAG: RNA pyrophosphohydrolase [Alphaproteobacteria bacterium]|mgnify:CR=1 FL=1|nr:RNA pyrophosphohydrolase [Alphaproteobacteria bacterium]
MNAKKMYRPNVGIMVLNTAGDVFMAHRTDSRKQAWQMPQGGIDKGEDEYAAALRELYEETNISSVTLIAESTKWYTYDFPAGVHFISEKKKAFAGQTQKWFLFQFTGNENEINLDKPDPEFNQWKWMPAEKIVEMIVPFKRDVYRQVLDEFMPFIEAVRNS